MQGNKVRELDPVLLELKELCEKDLYTFACTMFPERYYGDVHKEMFRWWQDSESDCQLALIPRDHQKSFCMLVYVAWRLTIQPDYTIAYVSANPRLAKKQLGSIKAVFHKSIHRTLWPEHMNYEKGRTGKMEHKPIGIWTQEEIELDHPMRRIKVIRDPSVFTTSVKSTNTGFHFHEVVFDDLVTDENYQSEAEKQDVIECYKNFAKIATTNSKMKAIGTRYGLDDLYALMKDIVYQDFDEEGNPTKMTPMWEIFERVVEDSPRRTGDGNYLWPKSTDPITGESYGFDRLELAKKKAQLMIDGDLSGFWSQYYNDPNDESMHRVSRDCFQYIDPRHLEQRNGTWFYSNKPLKLTAAADLAFSEGGGNNRRKRDYTAVIVIGRDADGYVYVLDMDRFQTDKIEVYYNHIIELHEYWGFREVYVETNNGGLIVKKYIEDEVRRQGGMLVVHGVPHTSHQGKKEERIAQALEPLYRNKSVYHIKGKYTRALEEEIMLPRPAHDDLKDCLAMAVEKSKKPLSRGINQLQGARRLQPTSRFGGVRRRKG